MRFPNVFIRVNRPWYRQTVRETFIWLSVETFISALNYVWQKSKKSEYQYTSPYTFYYIWIRIYLEKKNISIMHILFLSAIFILVVFLQEGKTQLKKEISIPVGKRISSSIFQINRFRDINYFFFFLNYNSYRKNWFRIDSRFIRLFFRKREN